MSLDCVVRLCVRWCIRLCGCFLYLLAWLDGLLVRVACLCVYRFACSLVCLFSWYRWLFACLRVRVFVCVGVFVCLLACLLMRLFARLLACLFE